MSPYSYKMVIAVRDDLKMSKGKTAVQVAHAAVNCSLISSKSDKKLFKAWYDEGQKKVALRVNDLEELFVLKYKAESERLVSSVITDAGQTELAPGTVTCIGIGPAEEEIIDRLTGDLKLL
ncbi:MAG: peptidyl-tRNA hydrolase, family [Candidatus Methanomethylophilaceae archaeon]|nr:peptidyl-tRNA hydrolase, family [Candidatus Methanomethylophilaceae archaeon]MDI3541726.1 peptidyl-tRNA hydrolase, family [Candidatus Methanomethylophilaceae archaeon]